MEEKLSIRNFSRPLKKYGSTSSNTQRNETLIKHMVLAGETLQGIALKYGVTTEQIRRANKLWASDSLFLREYLMIPVPLDSPFSPTNSCSSFDVPSTPDTSSSKSVSSLVEDVEDNNIDGFLEKYDSFIASKKKEVKKLQGNSQFVNFDSNGCERRKPASSRLKQSSNNNRFYDSAAQSVVMTEGKKVRTSLQRLERQQDEMFEL